MSKSLQARLEALEAVNPSSADREQDIAAARRLLAKSPVNNCPDVPYDRKLSQAENARLHVAVVRRWLEGSKTTAGATLGATENGNANQSQ